MRFFGKYESECESENSSDEPPLFTIIRIVIFGTNDNEKRQSGNIKIELKSSGNE